MVPKEAFLAPDILHLGGHPLAVASLRRLQFDDADGAVALADMLDPESVGVAGFGQLRAAIRIYGGDAASAAEILHDTLNHLHDEQEIADLSFQIGVCALAGGDLASARLAFDRASALRPDRIATAMARARLIWRTEGAAAGQVAFREAIERSDAPALWGAWATLAAETESGLARDIYAEGLSRHPGDPRLALDLAWIHLRAGRLDEFHAVLDGGAFTDGFIHEARTVRGLGFYAQNRHAEAVVELEAARDIAPLIGEAETVLASSMWFCGDASFAEARFRGMLARDPDSVEGALGLAAIYLAGARNDEAEALLQGRTPPERASVYAKLADLAAYRERPDDERAWLLRTTETDSGVFLAHMRLGALFNQASRLIESVHHYATAGAQPDPQAWIAASNALLLRHYIPTLTPDELATAHRAFGARFGGEGEDLEWRFDNQPDPDRRLRVAYISPDLRAHSVAFFMVSLIDRYDRDSLHVTVYYNAHQRDAATDWFEKCVDAWREVEALSHDELRKMIRRDRIDILVDLSGHTGRNRLMTFARRAAPVQVTYLGYPDTTGLPAMDYRIVDTITDPPEEANLFASEQLVRLPRTFLCYCSAEDIPDIAPAPSSLGRPFTFGSFNNVNKLNSHVCDAWAAILRAVPDARMLIKSTRFKTAEGGDPVIAEFVARGINRERLRAIPGKPSLGEHLATYAELDLCLDPFPYNGTTTICEAFSMGVPTLTLKGDRHSGRVGETLLAAMGMSEDFVADDIDDYVRRAVDWAGRSDELAAMRPGMRARLKASPLGDERGHARAMEAAYRAMWRVWCTAGPRYGLGPSPFERELHACAKI